MVAYTLSGASSGQSLPSQGVDKAHHTLEHSNDVAGLNIMGTFYAEKFAGCWPRSRASTTAAVRRRSTTARSMLGMECWSDSSSGHYLTNIPFILAGQGARQVPDGPHRRRRQERNNNDLLDLGAERFGHRLQHVRPGEPVQGPDRLRRAIERR